MNLFAPDPVKQRAGRRGGRSRALQGMETRRAALAFVLRQRAPVRVKELSAHLGRTTANACQHLKALVRDGLLERAGVRYVALGGQECPPYNGEGAHHE